MNTFGKSWQERALVVTDGSRFGAILIAAMGASPIGRQPAFGRQAVLTSDGYVMCDFLGRDGDYHMGAFVGSYDDLAHNVVGLCRHLNLTARERGELDRLIDGWIKDDFGYRRPPTCVMCRLRLDSNEAASCMTTNEGCWQNRKK